MSTRRLKVGVIGCGLVAQIMHLPYLRELNELYELTALCDISRPVVDHFGDSLGVARRFTRWEDMLDEPLDAMLVLTNGSHAPMAVAAAERGIHVLVEKPMCFSVAEGAEMIAAAEKAGTVLMVAYMKRYDPAYERLVEELKGLKEIRLVRVTTLEAPMRPYTGHYALHAADQVDPGLLAELRRDDEARIAAALPAADAGARRSYREVLLDSLVHELNALRGLLGEPDAIDFAELEPQRVTVSLRFGATRCLLAWVDLPELGRYLQEFSFYSPERRLTLSLPSPFLRSMPSRLIEEGGEPGSANAWERTEIVSFDEAFKRELVEFHSCVTTGRQPRTSGLDGLRDVALCEAIVAAHMQRSRIEQPTAAALNRESASPRR